MSTSISKKNILLVEDEALIAMNEAAMLKKYGYQVITAYNAREAIETAREKAIDLVLMDIDLGYGKMDGTEAAENILKSHELPIVFLTSHSEKEYVDKVKGITGYGYVLKNSGEFVLIESINMAFELFEAHQNLKQENEKRKKIEEHLREEQAELSAIYKHTPVLMIIVDKEHRVRKANAFATEFAGAQAENLIGKRGGEALRCLHHLDDPRGCGFGPHCEECKVRRTVTATFERGKRFKELESTLPFSIEGKEKAITFLLSTSYLEIKGEPFVIVSIEDITERKKLEKKLRESGEKFRLLFNYSNDAIFVHEMGEDNLPSKNIEVNKQAAKLLGYSREELLNMSSKDVTPEEHASTLYLHAQKIMEKHHLTFETDNIRSDGVVIPIEVSAYLYTEGNKKFVVSSVRDITKRKQAEKALKESEEKYRSLFDQAVIAVYLHDFQGDFIDVNQAACEQTGYSKKELLELNVFDIHPTDKDSINMPKADSLHLWQQAKSGERYTFKFEHKRKDGTIFPVRLSTGIVRYGNRNMFMVFVEDITGQKQAEKQLKNNEVKFRSVFSSSPDAMVLANRETGIIIEANQAAAELFEISLNELIGMHQKDLHPREEQALAEKVFKYKPDKAEQKAPPVEIEIQNRKNMKKIAEVRGRIVIINDDEYVLGNFRDITDRKKMEKVLETGTKFFTGIVENIPNMVFLKEAKNLTFYLVNKAAEETMGMKREDLIGKSDYDVFPKHEADFFREKDLEVINSGKEVVIQEEELTASDRVRYLFTKKVPIFDDEGNPQYMLGISEDITELKKALEEKDYLMKELNHRVKNSLMMITSLISLKNASLGETVDLTDVKNQIDAIRIVHEKLYKTETVTGIDFKEYIDDLLATIFASFSDRHVRVENTIPDVTLTAKTATPLGLIVNELATNAMKHGFTAGKEAVFSVDLRKDDAANQYVLSISNSGKPFPKDVALDNPETLGLQLISALVSQLEGKMELQRQPHPVFTITIPIWALSGMSG